MKTILVTGAYGHAGCKIVKGLLEKTTFNIIGTGRNLEKLQKLKENNPTERLQVQTLDVKEEEKLLLACQSADMIINASGPYSMIGFDIVKVAVKAEIPYIDLANEQIHLKRLKSFQPQIEASKGMVFTCTGQSPGISTLIITKMAKMVKNIDTILMFGVVGKLPTPDQALASMMGGVLEPSLESVVYSDGVYKVEPFGSHVINHTFPDPFGTMKMLCVPIAESILIPEVTTCKTVRTLFGLEMDLPPGIGTILKLLKPHKRKWAYNLLEKLMKKTLKDSYKQGLKDGFNPGGYMKVIVTGDQTIEMLLKVEDNSVMTSYMPIVIALNYFKNPEKFKGLLTPNDAYTFDSFNAELDHLGWKIPLNIVQSVPSVV